MAKYKNMVTTEAGLSLLENAAYIGSAVKFKSLKAGNGIYDGSEDLSKMTSLKSIKQTFGIGSVTKKDTDIVIRVIINNDNVAEGYYLNEFGLYAENPDTGKEVLYAVIIAEQDSADYLPEYAATPTKITLEMLVGITESEEDVTFAAVQMEGVYVPAEDFNEHKNDSENPHKVTKSQVGLSNVPNVATNDQTVTYTVASEDTILKSGEKLSVAFGKIARAVISLNNHLADAVSHITSKERNAWNNKLDKTATAANSNKLDEHESSYFATSDSVKKLTNGTTPVGNAKKLNGMEADKFVVNETLAINGYFKNPVNSSGKTSWSGAGVTIDKWSIVKDTVTAALVEDGLKVTYTGSTGVTGLVQTLPYDLSYLEGKTVTMSAKADGVVTSKTFTFPATLTGVAYDGPALSIGSGKMEMDCIKSASATSMEYRVIVWQAESTTIEWVKLEIGSVATPFVPPNKEVEKLKCGATVGDADTLDNKHASDFVQYLGKIADVDMLNNANYTGAPYEGIIYGSVATQIGLPNVAWHIKYYRHTDNNGHGYQEAKPLSSSSLLPKYRISEGTTWKEWKNSADGGNADTVDNKHASSFRGHATGFGYMSSNGQNLNDFKIEGHFFVFNSTNKPDGFSYGFLDVDYFSGGGFSPSGAKAVIRQTLTDWSTGKTWVRLYNTNTDIWSTWRDYAMSDSVFPLTGGNITGNVIGLVDGLAIFEQVGGHTNIIQLDEDDDGNIDTNNWRGITVFGHSETEDIRYALQLREKVDGVSKQYYILHTGNFANYTFKKYGLNEIDIDNTRGNWTVDIGESGHGTTPTSGWVSVMQRDGGHFLVQMGQSLNSASTGENNLYIRMRYTSTKDWSPWKRLVGSDELSNYFPLAGGKAITGSVVLDNAGSLTNEGGELKLAAPKSESLFSGHIGIDTIKNMWRVYATHNEVYKGLTCDFTKLKEGSNEIIHANNIVDYAEMFVANENLFINPYFKDPINTTEKTSWTGSSSSIALLGVFNQWNAEASNLGTLTLDASGLTLDKGTSSYVSLISSNAKTSLAQSVGEKFTVSVKANGEVYTYTFTAGTYLAGGVSLRTDDGTEILKLFYTSNEWIYFRNYNTTPVVIEWVKLEKGNLATSFIPPNPEVEKLKCGVGEASKAAKADYATNAGTVGGVSVKTDGTRGIPIVSSNYGLMEIGNGLDFHTEKGQDHAIRLSIENGFLVLRDSTGASLVATHSNLSKYFPIDGSKSLNGKQFWVQDKVLLENGVNAVYLMDYDVADDITNGTGIRILTKKATEDIKKRLQLCVKEDGVSSFFDILHSQNVSSYAIASTKVHGQVDVNTMVNEGSFFVMNGINLPSGSSTHGFMDVRYYNGGAFAPSQTWGATKCVRQIFYPYIKGTSNFVPQTRYGLLKTSLSTEWEWGEWSTDFFPLTGGKSITGSIVLDNAGTATTEGGELKLAAPKSESLFSGHIGIDTIKNMWRVYATHNSVYKALTCDFTNLKEGSNEIIHSNNIGSYAVTLTGTAAKAKADANGNNIADTYLTKTGTAARAKADANGLEISVNYAKKAGNNTFTGTMILDNGNGINEGGELQIVPPANGSAFTSNIALDTIKNLFRIHATHNGSAKQLTCNFSTLLAGENEIVHANNIGSYALTKGESVNVKIRTTAPSDTTALWVKPKS